MNRISIIVPVYNTSEYLEKCLYSLINQTIKNIEIIVVNDGSTDNSLEIINKIAKDDQRIKVYNKKNGGLSSARNYGIEKSTGKYIGFVDSDDYVREDMYEILGKNLENSFADMSICRWYIVENEIKKECSFKTENKILNSEDAINLLLSHSSFDNFVVTKLYKRELFDNIRFDEGKLLEDLLIMYKLINKARLISLCSEPLYYYVQRNNSITNSLNKKLDEKCFDAFVIRKKELQKMYPKLNNRINSNYFTANKLYFMISLRSKNRNKKFEKDRIKCMRKNIKYVWKDNSIPFRVKISSTLISIFPYLYFVLRRKLLGKEI